MCCAVLFSLLHSRDTVPLRHNVYYICTSQSRSPHLHTVCGPSHTRDLLLLFVCLTVMCVARSWLCPHSPGLAHTRVHSPPPDAYAASGERREEAPACLSRDHRHRRRRPHRPLRRLGGGARALLQHLALQPAHGQVERRVGPPWVGRRDLSSRRPIRTRR